MSSCPPDVSRKGKGDASFIHLERRIYVHLSQKLKKNQRGEKTVKITVNRVFCLFSNRKQAWNEVLVPSACERWPLFIGHLAGSQLMRPQRGCLKLWDLNACINPHACPSAAHTSGLPRLLLMYSCEKLQLCSCLKPLWSPGFAPVARPGAE